jgi:hypothetical protein
VAIGGRPLESLEPEWFDEWFQSRFVKRWYGALELSDLLRVDIKTIYRHVADGACSDESDGPLRIPREAIRQWLIESVALNL